MNEPIKPISRGQTTKFIAGAMVVAGVFLTGLAMIAAKIDGLNREKDRERF